VEYGCLLFTRPAHRLTIDRLRHSTIIGGAVGDKIDLSWAHFAEVIAVIGCRPGYHQQ